MTDNDKKAVGRAKNPPLEKIGPEFVDKTPQDMIDAEANYNAELLVRDRNLAVIDQTYGDNLPYDRTRIESEARFYLQQSALSMLELGKRLLVLREHEEHGQFSDALQRIGIEPKPAQRAMKASLKFGGPKTTTLSFLGRSKMLELMVEDDDELEALAEGGTLAGLKLDEIDKMSVRELKAALRKSRDDVKAQAEVHEKLLDIKNQKLDEMDRQFLERTKRVKAWSGVVLEISANLMTMSGAVTMNINHLRQQVEAILHESEKFNLSEPEMAAITEPFAGHIGRMFAELHELQAEFEQNLMGYLPVYTAPRD